nr:MAG TPA: hypothetical protein [Caudoviricetes sp.]
MRNHLLLSYKEQKRLWKILIIGNLYNIYVNI